MSNDLKRWQTARGTAIAIDVLAVGISIAANYASTTELISAVPPVFLLALFVLWEIMPKINGWAGRIFTTVLLVLGVICAFESTVHIASLIAGPNVALLPQHFMLPAIIDGTAIACVAAVVMATRAIREIKDAADVAAAAQRQAARDTEVARSQDRRGTRPVPTAARPVNAPTGRASSKPSKPRVKKQGSTLKKDRRERGLALIAENPSITAADLAEATGAAMSTCRDWLKQAAPKPTELKAVS